MPLVLPKTVPQKTVLVGLPTHNGWLTIETMYSLLYAITNSPGRRIGLECVKNSLLPTAFNMLLAEAVHARADAMVMVHADVQPMGRDWLQTLLEDMDRSGADLLSTPVRIKDRSGSYSMGLCYKESPHDGRRIDWATFRELPEIFGRDEVAALWEHDNTDYGPLLVNTGCMALNCRAPWIREVAFNIHSEIDYSEGAPHVRSDGEDWRLSRFLAEKGAKVLVTKRVRTCHIGAAAFDSATYDAEEPLSIGKLPRV